MTLTCGGKGPCCHVGYSHRHCEHCDLVIDTRQYVAPGYPWFNQYPRVTWGNGTFDTTSHTVIGSASTAGIGIGHACSALPSGA